MASVKIDLGFGEYAMLSERTGAGISTANHQRDAEEFLRRWPRTRSITQERDVGQRQSSWPVSRRRSWPVERRSGCVASA